ncbi:NAD-dependent dehydratase [Enterovibrio norvegicus]|uniref:UDP-glucose 4-epimerase family protein n=1 Tax=Enterovibrio norvegicus TaxID=188144 RepID=UPI0003675D02|nr:SDR family oxidoreductase [Enterovibrio norvegicus]OEF59640.1 NAD-dependent dehydratase [Enterovibrio norvegicus]
MKLLITGANGFVGRRVSKTAKHKKWQVKKQIRNVSSTADDIIVSDVDPDTEWGDFLQGIDCIIHCAARVHQMSDAICGDKALQAYRDVNTFGSLNLACQAAEAGVKRFVFISSIKVNGEQTYPGQTFISEVSISPIDPYGLSKYEAEIGLRKIAEETGMEVVIIRPPLIYGPGVKANFLAMMNLVKRGVPLPFGAIRNSRSLVYIENLVSLVILCCEHPNAANKTFLVSDNDDVSTTRMLNEIAKGMGRKSLLIPIPQKFIEFAAKLLGKSHIADRVCGNLQLDISDTMNTLSWEPPFSFEQGIQRTVSAYLSSK